MKHSLLGALVVVGLAAPATAQTQPANPATPPGMRDVTPRTNSQPGTTTGAATNRPTPPAPSSTDMNKATTPPADNAPAKQ